MSKGEDGGTVEGERYSYDSESLRRAMLGFERAYGLGSDDFHALHCAGGKLPAELPRFDRHVWASFVEDVRRLEGSSAIEHARRTFAHA
jgi:hypothetical protein